MTRVGSVEVYVNTFSPDFADDGSSRIAPRLAIFAGERLPAVPDDGVTGIGDMQIGLDFEVYNYDAAGEIGLPSNWIDTARVKMWNGTEFLTYVPAQAETWGPEVSYALAWLDSNPTGTLFLYLVGEDRAQLGAIAEYGSNTTAGRDWSMASNMWYAEATLNLQAMRVLYPTLVVDDILWLQGGADAEQPDTLGDYAEHATAIYAAMRSDWATPLTRITTSTLSPTYTGYDADEFLDVQQAVAQTSPLNRIVSTFDLEYQADKLHLTKPGNISLGERLFRIGRVGYAPTAITLSPNVVPADALAGYEIGVLRAACPDVTSPIVFQLVGSVDDYEVVGTELVVAGISVPPVAQTSVQVRAASHNGQSFIQTVAVTVVPGTQFWADDAVLALDFVNGRFYVDGVTYYSVEAMELSGVANYLSTGMGPDILALNVDGLIAGPYVVIGEATTGPTAPGATNETLFALDTAVNETPLESVAMWGRTGVDVALAFRQQVFAGATATLARTWVTAEAANAVPVELAVAFEAAHYAQAANGSVDARQAGSAGGGMPPAPKRLLVANNAAGDRPWLGVVRSLQVLLGTRTDAELDTLSGG